MNVNIEEQDLATFKQILCKWFGIACPPAPTGPTGPTPPASRLLNFGYYGGSATPNGIADFADHCNFLHIGSWGDWVSPQGRTDIIVGVANQMQAAKANGINRVMITADFCLFDNQFRPLPPSLAQAFLRGFIDTLDGLRLLPMIAAVYTVDEPDVNGIGDVAMTQTNALLRSVMSDYPALNGKPLVTTYGVNGTPGLRSFDWAGFDNYGTPIFANGEYQAFVAKLTPNQRVVVVPGGGSPWKDDPTPYMNQAQVDPRIVLIMPFLWREDSGHAGISSNGMASQYKAVGKAIKDANP